MDSFVFLDWDIDDKRLPQQGYDVCWFFLTFEYHSLQAWSVVFPGSLGA